MGIGVTCEEPNVRDSSFLQSADAETWSEWTVGTKDHVLGRIKSSLTGGRDE